MTTHHSTGQLKPGLGIIPAAAALVAAAMIPMLPAHDAAPPAAMAAPQITLTGAVGDGVAGIGGDISNLAAGIDLDGVFDLSGLFGAESGEVSTLFTTLTAIPGEILSQLESGVSGAFTDLTSLDFGQAFSTLAATGSFVATDLLGGAETLGFGLFDMAAVIPGDFMFNFGDLL